MEKYYSLETLKIVFGLFVGLSRNLMNWTSNYSLIRHLSGFSPQWLNPVSRLEEMAMLKEIDSQLKQASSSCLEGVKNLTNRSIRSLKSS